MLFHITPHAYTPFDKTFVT